MFHWNRRVAWQCIVVDSIALGMQCSIKINQRGIIQKQNKVELRFLCTALQIIASNMPIMFGVIWTNGDNVMLQTRNALWKSIKGELLDNWAKMEQGRVMVLVHCTSESLLETRIPSLKWFGLVMLRTRNPL